MADLSPPARIVQRHDPDRFLTALYAPPARREALFILYATNHELARAREAVSNPMLALIRLQWWREVAEGARRRHEVAGPLGEALDDGRLLAADILEMIEGREAETGPVEDLAAFTAYVRSAYGATAAAAGRALGAGAHLLPALADLGSAYGVAGVLRTVPALARQGRCLLPLDLLGQAGLTEADAVAPDPARLAPVLESLAGLAQGWLATGRRGRFGRGLVAAALPGVLARGDLRHPGRPAHRGIGTQARLLAASLVGRV